MKKIFFILSTLLLVFYLLALFDQCGTYLTLDHFSKDDGTACHQQIKIRGYKTQKSFENVLILIDSLHVNKKLPYKHCPSCTLHFYYPSLSIFWSIQTDEEYGITDSKEYEIFTLDYKDSIQTKKIERLNFPAKSKYLDSEIIVKEVKYIKSDSLLVTYLSKNDFNGYNLSSLKDAYQFTIGSKISTKNQDQNQKFVYIFKNLSAKKNLTLRYFDFGKAFTITL